jgi:hypothetical protein
MASGNTQRYSAGMNEHHSMTRRSPTRRSILIATLLALGNAACYPVHKTLAPAASMTVRDSQQRPIAGARVTLITNFYPHGRESARDTLVTDNDGAVHFTRKSAWEMEVLMIHGARLYFWNWCVEQPGFTTFESGRGPQTAFQPIATVKLEAGTSRPCESRRF